MDFVDGVPISTKLDILSSRIRILEREIQRLRYRRSDIDDTLEQLADDLQAEQVQFNALVVESGKTHSEEDKGGQGK